MQIFFFFQSYWSIDDQKWPKSEQIRGRKIVLARVAGQTFQYIFMTECKINKKGSFPRFVILKWDNKVQ